MSFSKLLTVAFLATSVLAAPSRLVERDANATADNIALIQALELAPTAADRINMLTSSDFVYDFLAPAPNTTTEGAGGRTVKSDRKSFPALIGTGVSMTLGFIGPCGFNTPHTHPRSSEINVIVQGRLGTQFVTENGANVIGPNFLSQYQMTVFPQGATHAEFNPDCEPAVFVAGFASEDPGVEQSIQTLFELRPDLVQSVLGVVTLNGESIGEFKNLLPPNVVQGIESCNRKCGIKPTVPNQGK